MPDCKLDNVILEQDECRENRVQHEGPNSYKFTRVPEFHQAANNVRMGYYREPAYWLLWLTSSFLS